MADYQESQINGTKWRRCFQLAVHNHRGAAPSIAFFEEDVMAVEDKTLRLGETSCSVAYDPQATVEVYDPVTLQPTGATFTHAELYGMLFSAYLQTALARDAAAVAPEPHPEPDPQPEPEPEPAP